MRLVAVTPHETVAMLTPELPGYAILESAVMKLAGTRIVVDLGTPSRRHKEMAHLHSCFKQGGIYSLGYRIEGAMAVELIGDILTLPLATESVGGIICLEVLEHVEDPWRAVSEINRILQPAGRLVLTVPFLRGWHGKELGKDPDHYDDYWRFTHQGLKKLFRDFREISVVGLSGRWSDRIERINSRCLRKILAAVFAAPLARDNDHLANARRFLVEAIK
jgi:SAM-dependent methyltransferase